MKKVFRISTIIFAAIILLLSRGCKKEDPECLTSFVSNISRTGVTLYGYVNPNGLSTIVTFEYDTTTDYSKTVTAYQSPVTGESITDVFADITGLITSKTYHFRVKAENSHWTVYGSDIEFEYGPPSVTALEVTNGKSTAATLNGSVNPRGLPTNVTFEYGTSTDYGQQATPEQNNITGTSTANISANISGLTCSTIYHFRLKAENSFDTTYSTDKTFLTAAGPPDAITLDAVKNTCTTATLNGSVQAGCASFVLTFQYGTDMASYDQELTPDQTWVTADGSTVVSRNISGLMPGTTYHFRLKAESSNGISYGSDETINTGLPSVTTASVSGLTATAAISGGNISEECLDITDRGVELYRIMTRPNGSGKPIYIYTLVVKTHDGTGPGSFTSTLTGLQPSNRYYVLAYTTNSAGTFHGNYIYFTTPGSGK
jgi:uncharacterized protein YegP (UPF0339 family)